MNIHLESDRAKTALYWILLIEQQQNGLNVKKKKTADVNVLGYKKLKIPPFQNSLKNPKQLFHWSYFTILPTR